MANELVVFKRGTESNLPTEYDSGVLYIATDTRNLYVDTPFGRIKLCGDMLKSTYDSNNDGIVDNAEKVNNHTVNTDVPDNALFTDTTYEAATENSDGLITGTMVTKLNGIDSNAQVNKIESISINGTQQSISSKSVNLAIPTTVAELTDSDEYALKSDIVDVYKYKGSVADYSSLPSSATSGDVYNTEDTGMNYAWTSSGWDSLGVIFSIEYATDTEITAMVESLF